MSNRDKLIAQAEALEDLRELCVPWGTWERDSRQRIAERLNSPACAAFCAGPVE